MDQSGANGSLPNQPDGQGHGQGLDQQHGQPAVPMIHRSVDDILSADFPPGIGSALPNDNVHANYMDGLDDLFSDVPMNLPGGAHFPGLPPNSSAIGSTQQQHQQPPPQQPQQTPHPSQLQQPQYIDQGSGAMAAPGPSFPQLPGQQLHMPLPSGTVQPLTQGSHIQLTPTVVTIPPAMPQMPQGPIQTHISLPNGRPAGVPALSAQPVRPPNTGPAMLAPPPALVAQAGSPLHKILNSVSPATGQQLTNLFALLQSNAVTPSEFLAQAERLLEPAQFEILDGIRRRHPPAVASDRSAASGNPGSAAPSPVGSSASTPTPAVVTPGSSSTVSTPAATPGPSTVPLLPPARATISPAMPSLPNVATPPSRVTPSTPTANANVITPALPPASSTTQPTSQSAPVRKRNTDATANTPGSEAISKPTKRVKTDASIPTPGAGASAAPTPALPSTGGPSTPASGAPSPGAFNRVSLPGQQKAAVTPTPGAASAAPAGVSTGAGSSAAKSSAAAAAANEKTNYDNITDVMGYVGVDLKEETDNIMRDNDGYSKSGSGADGQDRTRVQNFVNATQLKAKIERIASLHKLTVEADVLTYLAMAAQERLRGLAEQMIHASKHRGQSQSTAVPPLYDEDHAMYMVGVTQDVKKQLLAIERVEREEEFKRKEMIAERERKAALGEDLDENGEPRTGAGAGGAGSGSKKKKQKEGGPGVSARNMTEEARKKVANQTALGFAGGSGRSYSWMMGAGGAGGAGGGGGGGAGGGGGGGGGGGAASPMPSTSSGAASASSPAASGSSKPSLTRTATMPASTPSISVGGGSPGHASGAGSPSLSRGVSVGGGSSMILPPSTLGRPASLRDTSRKVNVKDALFCLERDRGGGGGEGSGQRVLVKSYVKWLK